MHSFFQHDATTRLLVLQRYTCPFLFEKHYKHYSKEFTPNIIHNWYVNKKKTPGCERTIRFITLAKLNDILRHT